MSAYISFGFSDEEMTDLLGREAAERDNPVRLNEFFFETATFAEMLNGSSLRLLVGHKGVGKSALFKIAQNHEGLRGNIVVGIDPYDVVDIPVSGAKFVHQVHQWRIGLLEIVIRKLFAITQQDANAVTNDLLQQVRSEKPISFSRLLSPDGPWFEYLPELTKRKLTANTSGNGGYPTVIVFIDDLDLGWQYGDHTTDDIHRIAALLRALAEMQTGDSPFRVRVSIRSDIFYLALTAFVDIGKIREDCRWYRWTNKEVLAVLCKRIATYRKIRMREDNSDTNRDERQLLSLTYGSLGNYLLFLFDNITFKGDGFWKNQRYWRIILTLIRKRPRDFVALLRIAGQKFRTRRHEDPDRRRPGGIGISENDLVRALPEYSQEIFKDTINEYKGELPDIEQVLREMGPTSKQISQGGEEGFVYTYDEIINKLNFVIKRLSTAGVAPQFFSDHTDHKEDRFRMSAENLFEFLFRINFLVARFEGKGRLEYVEREYFDEEQYDIAGMQVNADAKWEIHPAYRWVLSPQTKHEIYTTIPLIRTEEDN